MSRVSRRAGVALERSGATRLLRRLPVWRGALVLTYHRIAAGTGDLLDRDVWSATPEALDEQVAWLCRSVDVIGPDELGAHLSRPGRCVLLTFDDGYRDNWASALPILRGHGVRAAFFLTSGFLDRTAGAWWDEIAWMLRTAGRPSEDAAALIARYKAAPADRRDAFLDTLAGEIGAGRRPPGDAERDWMTWDHARELRDAGMGIGAHTATHPLLGGLGAQRQREEIEGSIARIAGAMGERPTLFALPDGRAGSHDGDTRPALRASGVRFAFCNAGGVADPRADPLLLPRVNIWHGISRERFRLMVSAPWALARG